MFEYSYFDVPKSSNCPLRRLWLVGIEEVVHRLEFNPKVPTSLKQNPLAFKVAKQQLEEYCLGQRQQFETGLFALEGLSPFFQRVLEYIQHIPYGKTKSYSQIAVELQAGCAQAVGGAMAKNPLPIFVPCHRIMGKDGQLTGFGGGLDTKQWLLNLESTN